MRLRITLAPRAAAMSGEPSVDALSTTRTGTPALPSASRQAGRTSALSCVTTMATTGCAAGLTRPRAPSFFRQVQSGVELAQLLRRDVGGRAKQQVLGPLVHRE